jgi:putative ABC transport system substrate-binding protein
MSICLRRREFITALGGAALAPLAVHAQQPAMPVIGFLNSASLSTIAESLASFRQGLKEHGYIEGQNVHLAFRWAEGRYDRLPALAAELVQNSVKVIAATGGLPSALAAKAATKTIPIVFIASDPVQSGLVGSLNRPGDNLTGVSPLSALLTGKRMGLLHDLVPKATAIGVLANPAYPDMTSQVKDAEEAAHTLGLRIHVVNASNERDLEAALASLAQLRVGALLVTADLFLLAQRDLIVDLAARNMLPAIYQQREFAVDGGLMSYGPDFGDAYRLAGNYTGRVLKGEKPADLPVLQSTKFEFVVNLKTAKALDLTFPPGLLAIADKVIE